MIEHVTDDTEEVSPVTTINPITNSPFSNTLAGHVFSGSTSDASLT